MRVSPLFLVVGVLSAACSPANKDAATDTGAAAPATSTASDPDVQTAGGGVPAGYTGRTDRESQNIADASYTVNGGAWTVKTGPAHIVWGAGDSASGDFTATASFELVEPPAHPEAFGLFIGGRNLEQPTQQYTYFLVRNNGEYLVKSRNGAETANVIAWTASPDVPAAGSGAKYELAVRAAGDSVRFLVNGKQVAAQPRSALPSVDGVAGLRINHNLHLNVTPVAITR